MRESVGGSGMTRSRSAGPYRSSCRRCLIVTSILYLIFAWQVVWWNKVHWNALPTLLGLQQELDNRRKAAERGVVQPGHLGVVRAGARGQMIQTAR